MSYFVIEPPPASMQSIVDFFWSYDGYAPVHTWDRVLATSGVDIVFPIAGQDLPWRDEHGIERVLRGPLVCGPRTNFYDVSVDSQRRIGGVRLRPGSAWSLLGVSVDELTEAFVPLDLFVGSAANELQERLHESSQHQQMSLLRDFVVTQLARSRVERHGAIVHAANELSRPTERTLGALADEVGLSQRRFIQLFRREVGLTPRDFRRVQRFHHVVTSSGDALDAGFFDQSHWALECRKLSGWTPTALRFANRGADVLPTEVRGQMLPILGR